MIILSAGSQELSELFVIHFEDGIVEELKYLPLSHFLCLPLWGSTALLEPALLSSTGIKQRLRKDN